MNKVRYTRSKSLYLGWWYEYLVTIWLYFGQTGLRSARSRLFWWYFAIDKVLAIAGMVVGLYIGAALGIPLRILIFLGLYLIGALVLRWQDHYGGIPAHYLECFVWGATTTAFIRLLQGVLQF